MAAIVDYENVSRNGQRATGGVERRSRAVALIATSALLPKPVN
jgi:hypothetical protein